MLFVRRVFAVFIIALAFAHSARAQNSAPLQVSNICTNPGLSFVAGGSGNVATGKLETTNGVLNTTYIDVGGRGIDLQFESFNTTTGATAPIQFLPNGSGDFDNGINAYNNPWVLRISAYRTGTNSTEKAELTDFGFSLSDFEDTEYVDFMRVRSAADASFSPFNIQTGTTITSSGLNIPTFLDNGFELQGGGPIANFFQPDKWVGVTMLPGAYHQIEIAFRMTRGIPQINLCQNEETRVVPAVQARPDTGTVPPGIASEPIANVTSNDDIDGVAIALSGANANATITEIGTWPAGFSLNTTTGAVSVASTVAVGEYTMLYKLCNVVGAGGTSVCSLGTVTITVEVDPDPVDDSGTGTAGIASTPIADVTDNDQINGVAATLGTNGNAAISQNGTWPAGFTLNTATGAVDMDDTVQPGTYTMTYNLCDRLSTPTCETGTIVVVAEPNIERIESILSDDLRNTITMLSNNASRISGEATDRFMDRRGDRCGAEINALLQRQPIYFATDSYDINPRNEALLDDIATKLNSCSRSIFMIAGHTDGDASEAYNLRLSQNRVDAVKAALVARGIATERLSPQGFGESRPIASNATSEGKARNRRVEFILLDDVLDFDPNCRDSDNLSRSLNGRLTDDFATLNGAYFSSRHSCVTDVYSETWASLTLSETRGKGTYGALTFGTLRERQARDVMWGRFIEGYVSRSRVNSADGTGAISGVGIHAGLYGARAAENGLVFSYYGSLAAGRHAFALDTGVEVDGSYTYAGVFAGGSLGGEYTLSADAVLRPRVGIDLAYGQAIGSEISLPGVELDIDPAILARGFAELNYVYDFGAEAFNIAPRVYCTLSQGAGSEGCGYGLRVGYQTTKEDAPVQWDVALDLSGSQSTRTATLKLARSVAFMNDFGLAKSSLDLAQNGALSFAQSVEFNW